MEGPAYTIEAKSEGGSTVMEALVDEDGVEVFWRTYFGYAGSVKAGADSDGDGFSDAQEAAAWTDPFTPDREVPEQAGAYERRQVALTRNHAEPLSIDGKPATLAEILQHEDEMAAPFREAVARQGAEAAARVAAWTRRTGQPQYSGGKGQPPTVVVDVVGEQPVVLSANGTVSNLAASIPPLWPGGAVGSNVTGYVSGSGGSSVRKNCGLWEVKIPRSTHTELTGRLTIKDGSTLDPAEPHGSFVAGIISATGLSSSFKGAAYGAKIDGYDADGYLTELSSLPLATIKDMRASNHSYGTAVGWVAPRSEGGKNWRQWSGDLYYTSAAANGEDYRFGHYGSEAVTIDTTARNKPYHLLVKTAGNDRGEIGSDQVFTLWDNLGNFKGYNFFFATYNGQSVLFGDGSGYNGLKFVYKTDIYFNYAANRLDLKPGKTSYALSMQLYNDGGQAGGYDSLSNNFTVAKNALTIGATNSSNYIASYSGWGPTDDGRIKPDVVALGGDIGGDDVTGLASANDTDYTGSGYGTSFAAPAAAGAVTLLSQYQENLRGAGEALRASSFKALLIHSATDLGNTGPDYSSGWGQLNTEAAATLIKNNTQRRKVAEVLLYTGTVGTAVMKAVGGQPVKVTIAWTDREGVAQPLSVDPPGNISGSMVLTNDLNLSLQRVGGGATASPWVLDPANPNTTATTGENNRDNVEQVVVASPTTNEQFTIRIEQKSGTTLVGGAQWVSVITEGLVSVYPASDELVITNTATTSGSGTVSYNVTFNSVMGGYYKVQYNPYGQPSTSWFDATGTVTSRADSTTCSFLINSPSVRPIRVVTTSPNPF